MFLKTASIRTYNVLGNLVHLCYLHVNIISSIFSVFLITGSLTGCHPATFTQRLPAITAPNNAQNGHQNGQITLLGGSAVLSQMGSGYQRVRWCLIGDLDAWCLEIYDPLGLRLLRLTKTNATTYTLQDRYGVLTRQTLTSLWQEHKLPVMISENVLHAFFKLFNNNSYKVFNLPTGNQKRSKLLKRLPDGWQLQCLEYKWQTKFNRWYPSILQLWQDKTKIRLLIDTLG